jgi:hypothetical protein
MAEPLLPRDDVSVIGMDDTFSGIFGWRSPGPVWQTGAEAGRETSPNIRPEVPLNIGFGAGDYSGFNPGNYRIDAAGTVSMPQFTVGRGADPTSGMFDFNSFGSTLGTGPFGMNPGDFGGGIGGVPNYGQPVQLGTIKVNENTEIDPTLFPSNLIALGYDPNAPFVGPVAGKLPTGDGGATVLPPFKDTEKTDGLPDGWDNYDYSPKPDWFRDYINKTGAFAAGALPKVTVTDTKDPKKDEEVYIPDLTVKRVPSTGTLNLDTSADPNAGKVFMGPVAGTTPSSGATAGGGSTATTTGGKTTPERDFAKELGITLAGLQQYKPELLGMYKDLYQSFMPKGLTAAETSSLAQMQADEAKLNRLRQGILSPEDIRTATQGAREAYGARGQVFAPGAIGAEILNREAIRQQREDQARAAYQQSMGNVLNVSNLQTGNIFQPISSLLSGTFNPLGAYPADVYGTNVNAALARDIAQKNYEAALESAKISGAAQQSAAKTSAGGSIAGALVPGLIKGASAIFSLGLTACMPGDQCIDTPAGPKPVKDLKGGDVVIGYNGEEAFIMQACSWNQDPTRTFLTITREDGSAFTVCDDHKILGIPAIEWTEGAEMAGSRIKSITASTGLLTSYDILTNQGGYRIAGVPVNSMIPEMMRLVARFEALSAVENPA